MQRLTLKLLIEEARWDLKGMRLQRNNAEHISRPFCPKVTAESSQKSSAQTSGTAPVETYGQVAHTLQGKVPRASWAHLLQMKEPQNTLWRPVIANFNKFKVYTTHLAKICYMPFQEHKAYIILVLVKEKFHQGNNFSALAHTLSLKAINKMTKALVKSRMPMC